MVDYYEFLQISPNADVDTIHRVYRYLAARFHPDNPHSGDPEQFRLLKTAYDVLSDKIRRAEYDSSRRRREHEPFSESVDFMDNLEGELNRRLAVLAVLYHRRRTNPTTPEVSLAEIEERMGFPRDYLDFTLWYLFKKDYVTKGDNAQFALTAEGVDFVETQRVEFPNLNKMLTTGTQPTAEDIQQANQQEAASHALAAELKPDKMVPSDPATPIVLPASTDEFTFDRRAVERRVGARDPRRVKTERRGTIRDRRANPAGRPTFTH